MSADARRTASVVRSGSADQKALATRRLPGSHRVEAHSPTHGDGSVHTRHRPSPPLLGRTTRTQLISLLLISGPVIFLAWAGWAHRWVADDAFIHFRVVSQLLAGHGPVINAGERVEASTSPAWVAMLAAGSVVPIARETLAVLLGLGLSLWALVAAQWGALALVRQGPRPHMALPVGVLILVALPPFWDFATSGLETGLEFGWLATVFWGLARFIRRRAEGDTGRLPLWLPVAAGVGVLVRPDFGLFCLAYLAVMVTLEWPYGRRAILRTILLAAVLPVSFELFRMGYYAEIVPNTALAKSATGSYWSQGWVYLVDFVKPYQLWFPAVVALTLTALLVVPLRRRVSRDGSVLVHVLLVTSLIYALYVVRLGGDFMHARMLLPVLFAICLPVAAVQASVASVLAGLAVLGWAIPSALVFRTPYHIVGGWIGDKWGITNEANYYRSLSGKNHPVLIVDYRRTGPFPFFLRAKEVAGKAADQAHQIQIFGTYLPLATGVHAPVVDAEGAFLGIIGYTEGTSTYIDDDLGLADPIASHLILVHRSRPGHERHLPPAWVLARFAAPGSWDSQRTVPIPAIQDADAALHCGTLNELVTAISSRMTPGQFASNVIHSFTLTQLRVPANPSVARRAFCG